mmetsp:Transcript_3629/g.10704  ORF Transcript_3629/g.10704 Transcript_3629/m.10704 type:complete len:201 (+) Transcript_3629:66-668(+)
MAKRKCTSDAERIATNIARMMCCSTLPARFTLDGDQIVFLPSSGVELAGRCSWGDKSACPRYCKGAYLRFEASLPDRGFLARYSVSCTECYGPINSSIHLFCSCCNEILTGHIASPGGKVSDHLVTIRHLFHEAKAQASFVRINSLSGGVGTNNSFPLQERGEVGGLPGAHTADVRGLSTHQFQRTAHFSGDPCYNGLRH